MNLRDPPPFGYDKTHDRPILRLESDKAVEGIELRAFGADDEMANTMFAVFAGDERIMTRHPEPLLVDFVADIVQSGAFTMEVEGHPMQEVSLDEDQQHQMARVERYLEEGLKDAPFGR